MYAGRTLSSDEFWARLRALDADVRELFAVRPTYGLVDWTELCMLDEWSLGDSTYRSLRYDGPDDYHVVVASSNDATDEPARHLLLNLPTDDTERFTDETKSLTHYERSRRAATGSASLSVSGAPVVFDIWAEDGYTVAGARVGKIGIGVRTNLDFPGELRLALVDEIEPYIEGRNDRIRALRAARGLDN
jgi:hypothetical protein